MLSSAQVFEPLAGLDGQGPPPRAVGRWLLLGNLLIATALVALAVVMLDASRDSAERRARVATENLAASLQQTVAAEIHDIDKALRVVAAAHRRAGSALQDTLDEQRALLPELRSLAWADAAGAWRHAAGAAAEAGEPAALEAARSIAGTTLRIEGPVRAAADGAWMLVISRRVDDGQGAFAGAAVATLPAAHFTRVLGSVELGARGAATLRLADFRLVARHTAGAHDEGATGGDRVSAELRQAVAEHPEQGSISARTSLDGIERRSAYRRVGEYPLYVVVGLGSEDYLAPWRGQLALVGGLVALLVLLVGGASVLLHRAWRREAAGAEALGVAARRNRALLLAASDGIHVLDRGGRVVAANEAFAEMLGERREAMIGRPIGDWDVQLSPQQIVEGLDHLRAGRRRRFETRHRRADGRVIDVEVQSVGVEIEGRDLVYCSARDITRRKELEAELAAAAAELQDLYDHAPCGYHSLDADGLFVHVNATELGWLGCTREEVVGRKRMVDFMTAEGRAVFAREFPRLFAEGRVTGIEIDLPGRDGALRRVAVSATAVRDAQGRFLHSRSVLYDITELERTRRALQLLTQEQQAMLDNDLIGIVRTRDGTIVWANRAMERLFGWPRDELVGRSAGSFYADARGADELRRASRAAFDTGERFRAQVENLRRDGKPIWIDANGLRLANGESLWLLADISAIKQSQERAEFLAFHDGLTGLPNRLLFGDRLKQAVATAERMQRRVALCFLDLDGFKLVNDRHGHVAGDRLLVEIAARLQRCVRANDTVCRLGGDEFVLLLTELDGTQAHEAVLERVRIELAPPVDLPDGRQAQVGASIGVALFPDHGRDAATLVAFADREMYAAKRRGRVPVLRLASGHD